MAYLENQSGRGQNAKNSLGTNSTIMNSTNVSKFLYYILQGVAKNILGREVEIKWVRTYISSGYHRAPKVRAKN